MLRSDGGNLCDYKLLQMILLMNSVSRKILPQLNSTLPNPLKPSFQTQLSSTQLTFWITLGHPAQQGQPCVCIQK
jgi:hypothetical protein